MDASSSLKAWTGRHVTLELKDETGEVDRLELDIVADRAADFARGFLGESTPLAKAILGHQAGEVVYYQAGGRLRVRILAVRAEPSGSAEEAAARRADAARRAAQSVEDTNARLFASSFSGKWGDYDPNAVGPEEDDDPAGTAKKE